MSCPQCGEALTPVAEVLVYDRDEVSYKQLRGRIWAPEVPDQRGHWGLVSYVGVMCAIWTIGSVMIMLDPNWRPESLSWNSIVRYVEFAGGSGVLLAILLRWTLRTRARAQRIQRELDAIIRDGRYCKHCAIAIVDGADAIPGEKFATVGLKMARRLERTRLLPHMDSNHEPTG